MATYSVVEPERCLVLAPELDLLPIGTGQPVLLHVGSPHVGTIAALRQKKLIDSHLVSPADDRHGGNGLGSRRVRILWVRILCRRAYAAVMPHLLWALRHFLRLSKGAKVGSTHQGEEGNENGDRSEGGCHFLVPELLAGNECRRSSLAQIVRFLVRKKSNNEGAKPG